MVGNSIRPHNPYILGVPIVEENLHAYTTANSGEKSKWLHLPYGVLIWTLGELFADLLYDKVMAQIQIGTQVATSRPSEIVKILSCPDHSEIR